MPTLDAPPIFLIGLRWPQKTRNRDGQSSRDCGQLWQEFEKQRKEYGDRIPESAPVYAVYFDYGDEDRDEFAYFVGVESEPGTPLPPGWERLDIPAQSYHLEWARGKMTGCISDAWARIQGSGIERGYHYDMEIYDHRARDWENAEVEIRVSLP